jgi:hypothetical protein
MTLLDIKETIEQSEINRDLIDFILQEKSRLNNVDIESIQSLSKTLNEKLENEVDLFNPELTKTIRVLEHCNIHYKKEFSNIIIEQL